MRTRGEGLISFALNKAKPTGCTPWAFFISFLLYRPNYWAQVLQPPDGSIICTPSIPLGIIMAGAMPP